MLEEEILRGLHACPKKFMKRSLPRRSLGLVCTACSDDLFGLWPGLSLQFYMISRCLGGHAPWEEDVAVWNCVQRKQDRW